jgi:putative tryptophan/tyrosine transport system substrate-binding protein
MGSFWPLGISMKRRQFISLLGGAAAWPLAVRAQQPDRIRRLGVLFAYAENDPEGRLGAAAFRQGLQALGWTEGRNITTDYRWAAAEAERTQTFVAELVALKPDVILASSSLVLAPLQRETRCLTELTWSTCSAERRLMSIKS